MFIDKSLQNKCILVGMDKYDISTDEKPLIGTSGLGPCISFVLYSPEKKRAIIGHVSKGMLDHNLNLEKINKNIVDLIKENNLLDNNFNLILIEGGQKNNKIEGYNIDILMNLSKKEFYPIEVLCENLKHINCINIMNIREANEKTDDIQVLDFYDNLTEIPNNESFKQFIFNATTGKFITSDVFCYDENKNIKKY